MFVEKYSASKKELWDTFIDNSKNGTFMLKRDYMDYHSDRFKDNSLMFYDENDNLIALLPASIHREELRSHGGLTYGGFIVDVSMKSQKMLNCFNELKNYMKENKIKKLIYKAIPYIYHNLPSQEDLYALFINNAKLFRRDISTTIDLENKIKMPKGRKAQISRAKREGVEILESNDFSSFMKLEEEILKEKHNAKPVHSAEEIKLLQNNFPQNIKLFIAQKDREIIAGTIVFVYKNLVHTQYMAANELAREIGGLDLLIANLIKKYSTDKKYFDFGISTENDGKILNEGLIRQKEGFGGRAVVYDFYEWEII